MKFIIVFFLFVALLNVDALRLKKASNTDKAKVTIATPPSKYSGHDMSLLDEETYDTSLLEETAFELQNFYEYYFYAEAYQIYNVYASNKGLVCTADKQTYWFGKKLDVQALGDFCYMIGNKINSSYLKTSLCPYIANQASFFNIC